MNPNPTQDTVKTNLNQQEEAKKDVSIPIENISTSSQTEEKAEDPNWKAARERMRKDRADKEAAERRAKEEAEKARAFKEALDALVNKQPSQSQSFDGQYQEEGEDEKIEKKVAAALQKQQAEFERSRLEREKQELPTRLRQSFPDYDQVINEENGMYLEYHHPEIYRSLIRQPENFESLSDVYRVVKKLVPNSAQAKKESMKAESNLMKPKSMSSPGLTQSTEQHQPNLLSEDRKKANWERMQKALKGVS